MCSALCFFIRKKIICEPISESFTFILVANPVWYVSKIKYYISLKKELGYKEIVITFVAFLELAVRNFDCFHVNIKKHVS